MNRFRQAAARVATEAREALRTSPLEIALGFALAVRFSWLVEAGEKFDWDGWFQFLLAFCPGWLVVFSATTLHRLRAIDAAARWLLSVAGVALAVAYHAQLANIKNEAEIWRFFVLLAGLACALTVLPLAARGARAERRYLQWQFTFRLTERVAQTAFYCLILFGGMAGAIAAIQGLFDLNLYDELYAHLFSLTVLALGPWLLAAGIPWLCELQDLPLAQPQPDRLSRTLAYLVVPLGIVYLAILYAYYAKVMVTGELPKNLISPLTLGAGFIGLGGVFALEPFRAREDYPLLSGFQRWFSLAYLPLVPLAAWAISIRIGDYGVTEFRYLRLLVLGTFSLIALLESIRALRKEPVVPALVPGVLAVALIAASFGPWGMVESARRSQSGRLHALLTRIGVPLPIDFSKEPEEKVAVSLADLDTVRNIVRYIADHHGLEGLATIADTANVPYRSVYDLIEKIPIYPDATSCDAYQVSWTRDMATGVPLNRTGRAHVVDLQRLGGHVTDFGPGKLLLRDAALVIEDAEKRVLSQLDFLEALGEDAFKNPCVEINHGVPEFPLPETIYRFELRDSAGKHWGEFHLTSLRMERWKLYGKPGDGPPPFSPWHAGLVKGVVLQYE